MKQTQAWMRKIDALTLRERAILFVLLLSGIWLLMDAVLLAPLERARKAEQQKITQARTQLAEAEQTLLLRASQPDPDRDARQRLDTARQHLDQRMRMAANIQARLVAPKDMPRVLQGMLGEQPGLRLGSLETLAPEPVGQPESARNANSNPGPVVGGETAALYKHGVKLTLIGNYAALTHYMERLERLPVGFYWARAELDASAHPAISLTLTLYTLSLERTWLTV